MRESARFPAAEIARLHGEAMQDSLVSALGPTGLRLYYEFVAESPEELLLTIEQDGRLAGACVFSFAPHSLMNRFFAAHPLAIAGLMLLRLPASARLRRFLAARLSRRTAAAPQDATLPELVQIFVAGNRQRSGLGARLLSVLDDRLRARGIARYVVKTEDEAGNPALGFYRKHGYRETHRLQSIGKTYLCFEKRLDA